MSNKTKTGRKNRTNLSVQWPTKPFWTVEDLWKFEKNSEFILITLRVRLQQFVERGEVVVIGELKGDKGRPRKVYAQEPVKQETLDAARAEGVMVDYSSSVKVLDVKATPPAVQNVTPVSTVEVSQESALKV